MRLEQRERHYLAEMQAFAVPIIRSGGQMPTWDEVKQEWLAELYAEPQRLTVRERRLRQLLGV